MKANCGIGVCMCSKCGSSNIKVKDSRSTLAGFIKRRRYCVDCREVFTSYESRSNPAGMEAKLSAMLKKMEAISSLKEDLIDLLNTPHE